MTILVLGGTGKVGASLVSNLLDREAKVRVLVRHPDRAALLPTVVESIVADPAEAPEQARAAFAGVDAVFMLNAVSLKETVEGLAAVAIAKAAGVRYFVYQSSHSLARLHAIPHLGAKLAIEQAVKSSGMDYTILAPNHFFQNDEDCRYGLQGDGTFLNPIGLVGCSRVDARDIAEAAAIVLTTSGHAGRTYPLVGPEKLTGPDCASVWADALGKTVHYVGDPERWRQAFGPSVPAWLCESLVAMFDALAESGMPADAGELATLTALLGRPPRRYADYVAERAAVWQQATA